MKKFKLLLCAMLFSVASLSAQSTNFGLTAGSLMGRYSIDGISDDAIDNKSGFQLAASWNAKFGIVAVGPEAIYSYSKMRLSDSSIYGSAADITVNAVDIPILATLSILGPIQLQAGPSFSIYNKGKARLDSGEKVDIGRVRPEVGYTAGLQVVVLKILTASARYNGEFGSHSSNLGVDGGTDYNINHHSFVISVGARF